MPGDWIKTASGKAFDFLDPDPESIVLVDICYALSHTFRFAGHSNPYSVASHSIAVGDYLRDNYGPRLAAWGYLHDAAEAYVGDMPSPIKRHLPNYQRIENLIQFAICEKFMGRAEPPYSIREIIKNADRRALAAEVPLIHSVECDREWAIPDAPMSASYIREGARSRRDEGVVLHCRILEVLSE